MKKFILPLFLLLSFPGFSQKEFVHAKIGLISGDTLKGYLNIIPSLPTPQTMEFKLEKDFNAPSAILSCRDVAFIDIRHFMKLKGYIGRISMEPVDVESLKEGQKYTFKEDSIFIEILTTGKNVTLYKFTDDIKTRFFISQPSTAPVELIYKVHLVAPTKVSHFRGYQQQLINLLGGDDSQTRKIKRKIMRAKYDDAIMIQIVNEINALASAESKS